MREEIIGTIPQANGEVVLEIALMHDEAGRTMVELRYLVWGRELGWYRQQTLTLDSAMASQLLCRLSSVRHRLRSKSDTKHRTNVLAFPRRRLQHMATGPSMTTTGQRRIEVPSASGRG